MQMPSHSDILQAALIGYQAEITRIEKAMAEVRAELKGSPSAAMSAAQPRTRSKFSAATRKKMAAAQKARWAAVRAQKSGKA
jgi:hypothetical protein